MEKSRGRVLYEEARLLLKDTAESIGRIKKIANRNDTHYILVNDHIGDVIIVLGYLKAFREQHGISRLALVVHDKFRGLSEKYSDYYEELILKDTTSLYRAFLIGATRYGEFVLNESFPKVTIINPADSLLSGFGYARRFPDLNLVSMIKYGCLKLDRESVFVPISTICDKQATEETPKRAVFSIDSRTVIGNTKKICEHLVPWFVKQGYDLYTNTEDSSNCIEGTKPIFLKLEELGAFIQNGVFIGPRSGIHDLLAYYDCMTIAFYFPEGNDQTLFPLTSLPCTKGKFIEIETSSDYKKDCSEIIDFFEGKKY